MHTLYNLLSFKTSSGDFSISIYQNDDEIYHFHNEENSNQAENLFAEIENALIATNLKREDITHLATTKGAGGFTGLRIGLAAIESLQYALGVKAFAVPDLYLLAHAGLIRVALLEEDIKFGEITLFQNARRGEYFSASFEFAGLPLKRKGDYKLASSEEIQQSIKNISKNQLIITDDENHLNDNRVIFVKNTTSRDLGNLLTGDLIKASDFTDLSPLYIRKPV